MKNLFYCCVILLIICSCEKDATITDIDYLDYLSNNSITSEIIFYPTENYENYNTISTPDLKLHFMTTDTYWGGILFYTKFIEKNELIIRFDSIQTTMTASLEPRSATANVNLPDNINKISLINGHFVDKYDVSISKEKVEIDSIVKNFTDVINDKIFRYPENTFNFTCWTDSSNENLCIDFLNILKNEISLVEYEFIGEGKIPFPYYTSNEPNHFTAIFKYEDEFDYDKVGELLREYTLERIPQNQGKSISLWGWNNKNFHSYTFY